MDLSDEHSEFKHLEYNLVISHKTNDNKVLFTLIKRLSRQYWMIQLKNRHLETVINELKEFMTY